MGNPLGTLAGWVEGVVQTLGYPGVFFLIALENLFPPIPSELILPLAGFEVGRGEFHFLPVVLAATAGSVAGALILYGIGWKLGEGRVRQFVRRYGKYALLREQDIDRAHDFFERHGAEAVGFGRLVPGVRSIISIPAGVERMTPGKFVLYTTLGSGIWNTALIGAGWWLGDQWQTVSAYMQYAQYAIYTAIAIGVGWVVYKRAGERERAEG